MNETIKTIKGKVLSSIVEGAFHWFVILALSNGPEKGEGMTVLDIKKELVNLKIIKSQDQIWFLVGPEVIKLKASGLISENKTGKESRFKLTSNGTEAVKDAYAFVRSLNLKLNLKPEKS